MRFLREPSVNPPETEWATRNEDKTLTWSSSVPAGLPPLEATGSVPWTSPNVEMQVFWLAGRNKFMTISLGQHPYALWHQISNLQIAWLAACVGDPPCPS
jgi:hypothetical protein